MEQKLAAVMEKYRSHFQFIGVDVTDPRQPGALGDTMLHFAAEYGDADEIEVLVAAGVNVNAIGDIGNTPLHSAALMGKDACVKRLLELGADPTVRNEFGETAEDWARALKRHEVLKVLRSYGSFRSGDGSRKGLADS